MFDMVDTLFSYGRGLIACSSLQEFSKTKESTLHVILNADTAFLPQNVYSCIVILELYPVIAFYQICKALKIAKTKHKKH